MSRQRENQNVAPIAASRPRRKEPSVGIVARRWGTIKMPIPDRAKWAEKPPNVARGIYQITNQVNGKRYIGSAVNLGKRQREHLNRLCRGDHHNFHLQAAFDKYGEATFIFTVLEYVIDISQLIKREQHFLDILKPEYNSSPTAGNLLGYRHNTETCAKLSAALMGHPVSAETGAKISAAKVSHPVRDETRAKLSAAASGERNPNYGKHLSEESKRKMSAAHIGKHLSMKTRAKMSAAHMGERNHMYGKHHSKETRWKISDLVEDRCRSAAGCFMTEERDYNERP